MKFIPYFKAKISLKHALKNCIKFNKTDYEKNDDFYS